MTAEFSSKGNSFVGIPQEDREWLMRTQSVPKGWAIWIGKHVMNSQSYRWVHLSFQILDFDELPPEVKPEDRRPNSQTTKFTIGHLLFYSFSSLPTIAEG
ncbi:MAG: hypothetical protein KGM15_12045 [Pseudomonadota bacterium]|nr:hypothetical protein [Pseudomonadota bacterium]